MRIRWTPAAAADLQSISEYLKEHHPSYRDPTMRKLSGAIRELKMTGSWPPRTRGRNPRILFPPTPYVAVYRVREQTIVLLSAWFDGVNAH
jgi:plasmid stabilization system protein ParE